VIGEVVLGTQRSGGNSEAKLLPVLHRIDQRFHDLAQHAQALRFGRVEHAFVHGSPRLHIEDVGKTVRFVAVDHDVGSADGVRHLLLLEHAFRHLRKWNGDERVQLRLILKLVAHPLRQADPASADIQTDGGIIDFVVMSHDDCRWRWPLL
jgi:hypothetical protein